MPNNYTASIELFRKNYKDSSGIQSIKFKEQGVNYLAAFAPFEPNTDGLRWILTTYAPKNAFLKDIRSTEKRNILIALFILLLSMVIGWLLATRAWKPVENWRDQAITDQLTGVLTATIFLPSGSVYMNVQLVKRMKYFL